MGPQPTAELRRAAEVRGHVVVSGVKDEPQQSGQEDGMQMDLWKLHLTDPNSDQRAEECRSPLEFCCTTFLPVQGFIPLNPESS